MKINYDADGPPSPGEPVAVIGYASQGRAHALNQRGQRRGRSNDADHQIEKVGRELRSMMTWLEPVEK